MTLSVNQSILQDRPIAYVIANRELVVIEVKDALTIFDAVQDSLGRSLLELVPELVGSEAVLADILAGELPRFELAWINRDTAQRGTAYLTMVDLPYRDKSGQIVGLIHVVEDVTVMGQLEQRLAQHRNELRLLRDQLSRQNLELAAANAELQRLDEIKTMFVSVAAHELRTPLTAIKGYLEVLLDEEVGSLNRDQNEYLQIVEGSADRLLDISNSLLDVTRIETGRIELVLQPLNLSELIKTVAAEFGAQLEANGQRLTLCAPPDLPAVLCDATRVMQIIGNLLSNASKYSPQGGEISVSIAPASADGFVQISVADDGVGIGTEDQTKLFSRFFRAESATRTRASGTGLGLYITRSLVELHGGSIWVESVLDGGSTFHVTLPAADSLV